MNQTVGPEPGREFVKPDGPLAASPLSAAVRLGEWILVSGQIGLDDEGRIVPGGVGGQTRACLEALKSILAGMEASLSDVVHTRIFLTDFADYNTFNEIYQKFFSSSYPTRSTVGTTELALGAAIEIEAIAVRGNTA